MNNTLALAFGALGALGGLVLLGRYIKRKKNTVLQDDRICCLGLSLEAALNDEAARIAAAFGRSNATRTLGPLFPGYYVNLDDLADYHPGDKADFLLTASGVLHCPLYLDGGYFCLISLRQDGDHWQAISSTYADEFDAQYKRAGELGLTPGSILFVPALNERFLCATREDGQKYVYSTGQWPGSPSEGVHTLQRALTKLHPQAAAMRNSYLR